MTGRRYLTPRTFVCSLVLFLVWVLAASTLPARAADTDPKPTASNPIADVICAPDAQMRHRMKTGLASEPAWLGLRGPDQVMELWEDARGDWTLLIANASGTLCIVAMGTGISPFHTEPRG
jgi:hypothetical protein